MNEALNGCKGKLEIDQIEKCLKASARMCSESDTSVMESRVIIVKSVIKTVVANNLGGSTESSFIKSAYLVIHI